METRLQAFLLDENIPKKVLSTLRVAGYSATRNVEKLGSESDAAIFRYARTHQMTIITFDTDYTSRIQFPPPHAGILIIRFFPRNTPVRDIASAVLSGVKQLSSDISNRVYRIDPDGIHEEE